MKTAKQKQREQLDRDTQSFLSRGGVIQKVPREVMEIKFRKPVHCLLWGAS